MTITLPFVRLGQLLRRACASPRQRAFSLLDLLAVLGALAVLALTLIPALARTKADSRAFLCLNNARELTRAWQMWSDDNAGLLLYASQSSPTATNRVWVLSYVDFPGNWSPEATIMKSPMWIYCGTNVPVWRCPSDPTTITVNGVTLPRVRSYAMNFYLGGFGGGYGGYGPELSNYRLYLKSADLDNPKPASLFVFTEMRPDALGGSEMITRMDGYSPKNPAAYKFQDYPAAFHDGGAVFSFADGGSQVHRWQDVRTMPPIQQPITFPEPKPSPYNPDIAWLQERATRPK